MTSNADPAAGRAVKAANRAYVFHSWSAQALIDPLAVAGAEGSYFRDYDGRRYLDFSHMNRLHVVPPCTITEAEAKEGLALLDEALTAADTHCG